jgi:hypothetical protein
MTPLTKLLERFFIGLYMGRRDRSSSHPRLAPILFGTALAEPALQCPVPLEGDRRQVKGAQRPQRESRGSLSQWEREVDPGVYVLDGGGPE